MSEPITIRELALTREELLGIAIARGCSHYRSLVPNVLVRDNPAVPHEFLGCALLSGSPDADTFQAIRVGAMVLSDLLNDPQQMAKAATKFGVVSRLTHIARMALEVQDSPDCWRAVLACLPTTIDLEAGFLPGASRFRSESPITGPGRGPSRVWLRTNYHR